MCCKMYFFKLQLYFFQHVKCEPFLFSLTQEQRTKIPMYLYCNVPVQMAINIIIIIQLQLLKVPIKS